jgi:hypothetical protein
MCNLARSNIHVHRRGVGLIRCNPVLPSGQDELEAVRTKFGLPYYDVPTSKDSDLDRTSRFSRWPRTLVCFTQQSAETEVAYLTTANRGVRNTGFSRAA